MKAKLKIRYRLLLFLILILGSNGFSQVLEVKSNEAHLIGQYLRSYEDKTASLNYAEVLELNSKFELNEKEVFADIATASRIWFSFSLQNFTDNELWIDINNANITEILFYRFDEQNNLIDSVRTGATYPEETRETNVYTFQFKVADPQAVKNTNVLFGIRTHLAFEVPVFLGSYPEIAANRKVYDYPALLFIGGVLLLLLYNLFIYTVTRDRIYLHYVVYLVANIFIGTYTNNFPIVESVLGQSLTHDYLDLWLWLIFGTTGLFTITYFDLRKTAPIAHKIIVYQIGIFILFGVLNVFIPLEYIANWYQIFATLFFLTCLIIGYVMLFKGYARARLFCVGWTGLMLGAIAYLLVYNGYLPYNSFSRNISYYGSLFELMVFSVALGQRINNMRIKEQKLIKVLTRKNNELVSLNESLDSFNYHVSHDLKTVLNNTKALSNMVKKYNGMGDSKKVSEIVEKLETVADNGINTVRSFLSLGKVDDIFQDKNIPSIVLKKQLDDIVEHHDLSEKIEVIVLQDEICEVRMHEKALESIFLNLFTNTIKYNENTPTAEIKFRKEINKLVFDYKDNGIGIDTKKYGESLFKPFQRANASPEKEGTGVGLYLVKKIVNKYNGTIDIESEPQKGTRFIMTFPNSILQLKPSVY